VLEGKSDEEKEKLQNERKENEVKLKDLYLLCHSNLAQVLLKQKNYDNAKEHCEKALEINPNHTKTVWRLAQVYKEINQFDNSLKYLTDAKKTANPSELKGILKEISDCIKLQKEQSERDKKTWTGIFKDGGKGLYEGVEPGKPELWKCPYCGQEMEEIQRARHMIKMHDPSSKKEDKNFPDFPDKINI